MGSELTTEGRWGRGGQVMEVFLAPATALGMVFFARTIDVDPLDRVGQVSGLAALQSAFAVIVAACIVVLVVERSRDSLRGCLTPLVAAALAGSSTGLVAGGVLVALRGTPWGLFADLGDAGNLGMWARQVLEGVPLDMTYPPGYIWLVAAGSMVLQEIPAYALKQVSIVATALIGPVGYLAWRTIGGPTLALMAGVVAALPLIDPYKPVTNTTLVVMVPVLVHVVRGLRGAGEQSWGRVVLLGAVTGLVLGGIALTYSGWFAWSAPGAILLFSVAIPWRAGIGAVARAVTLLATAGIGFLLVSAVHVVPLLSAGGASRDTYFYFDVLTDPAYIAAWRGDLPGAVGEWPPPGELGGVGVFTLALACGLAVAVATSWRLAAVQTATFLLAGAWVMRHWYAASMFEAQSVQLWPRTTPEILYCLLVLGVVACRSGARMIAAPASRLKEYHPGMARLGVFVAIAFVLASAGSSIADRYMPVSGNSAGELSWRAHTTPLRDGSCPPTAPDGTCKPVR